MDRKWDFLIAGGGLAGLACAIALGSAGWKTAIIAPAMNGSDGRTTALLDDSISFLDRFGAGDFLRANGNPLRTMRIIDDTSHLFRAPQVDFHASEIGLSEFGFNIRNEIFAEHLRERVKTVGSVIINGSVTELRDSDSGVAVGTEDGRQFNAEYMIGADGRNSTVRALAGISSRSWRYDQVALVMNFSHELSHHNASSEFHTAQGPFTIVPIDRSSCGLVWVMRESQAAALELDNVAEIERQIEQRMYSMLGKVKLVSDIQQFPIAGHSAARFADGKTLLVGEAAHAIPPIGAQGFNLGIRDIETLVRLAGDAGSRLREDLADTYHGARIPDISSRSLAIDLLNRSLLTGFVPFQLARAFGLGILSQSRALRKFAMREGIAPGGQLRSLLGKRPPAMRPQ